MQGGAPFGFAGLWDRWEKDGQIIESCTIITTVANELTKPIHERMPVILPPDYYDQWMDPSLTDAEMLIPLLKPYPSEAMEAYPVSTRVNNPRNNEGELLTRHEA